MTEPLDEICSKAIEQLEELRIFLENNPSLETKLRTSMANLFGPLLGIESMRNPSLLQSTDEIINITVMAASFGYKKCLEDNPIIKIGGKEWK